MKPFEQATTEELRALWEAQQGTPEIAPADPLTEPPELGERYYYYAVGGKKYLTYWDDDEVDASRFEDKNVFPPTPEGKAGAELRGKVHHPGIHWQKDLEKVKQFHIHANYEEGMPLLSFLDKYLTE